MYRPPNAGVDPGRQRGPEEITEQWRVDNGEVTGRERAQRRSSLRWTADPVPHGRGPGATRRDRFGDSLAEGEARADVCEFGQRGGAFTAGVDWAMPDGTPNPGMGATDSRLTHRCSDTGRLLVLEHPTDRRDLLRARSSAQRPRSARL